MESYDILVIILSTALILSIILWTVVAVLVIQVVKKVKATTDTATQAVENVKDFTQKLKTVGDVSAVGSAINQVTKFFKNKKEK